MPTKTTSSTTEKLTRGAQQLVSGTREAPHDNTQRTPTARALASDAQKAAHHTGQSTSTSARFTTEAVAALAAWFDAWERPLPWRAQRDPWGIYLSEVMGQQTPMSRVVPRWHEWIDRWPTPTHLAEATDTEVLHAWQSLGYPRRAIALHRAARIIRDRHDGAVPDTESELRALPGVGTYTASAILAFAFGQRVAVVDTNIRRVLARTLGRPGLSPSQETALLLEILPREPRTAPRRVSETSDRAAHTSPPHPSPARTSEALMELGALICTPRPRCAECPLFGICSWRGEGPDPAPARRPQKFTGTDRQARGKIMAYLRDAAWAPRTALIEYATVSDDADQADRALASLLAEGLVTHSGGRYYLGGA